MDPIEIPEDLTAESTENLTTLLGELRAALTQLRGTEQWEPETLETVQTLSQAAVAVRDELRDRDQRVADMAAAADEAFAAAEVDDDAEVDDLEAVDSDDAEDDAEDGDGDGEAVQASAATTPERRTIHVPNVARTQPDEGDGPTAEEVRIIAASGAPGLTSGSEITDLQAAEALLASVATFPKTPGGPRVSRTFANLEIPWPDELTVADLEDGNAEAVLDRAVDQSRLPGGSLLAAGGWCSPSETIYTFCELESREGLLDLPGIRVRRGGVRHTLGPDFRAIYDNSGFCYTEQEDIDGNYDGDGPDPDGERDGNVKPCYDVPCPPFVEDRLGYCGLCVTSGILQDRAYPELTRRVVRGAVTAHMHRLSWMKLQEIIAGSDAVTVPGFANDGATASILSAIELQVEDFRYKHRLSRRRTLETIMPFWVMGVIRADLSRRLGVELLSVSDSRIRQWFSDRNIRVQFVYNWQDDWTDGATGFGGATAMTEWPGEVEFLLYTAGTWVEGSQALIELSAVYDSTLFRRNNFVALFSEEAWLVAKRCHESRLVTVPICPSGHTGAGQDFVCA